jgi:hypothetical protein
VNAAEYLDEAQTAFEHGALERARNSAWRAAAGAAQTGNIALLEQVVTLTRALAASDVDEGEQLRIYAEACLEDAKAGTRPPSAFERLITRDRRPR